MYSQPPFTHGTENTGKTMRIISGRLGGRRIKTVEGEGYRPAMGKTRESLFSMLTSRGVVWEGARVLDLFAGSGQLAIEALSRGASRAVLCDSSHDACKIISKNLEKTHLSAASEVICRDYARALKKLAGEKFDIVFLDPPYKLRLIDGVLARLAQAESVSDGGIIVCEDERPEPYRADGYTVIKHGHYGRIYITVLKKEDNGGDTRDGNGEL